MSTDRFTYFKTFHIDSINVDKQLNKVDMQLLKHHTTLSNY